MSKWTAVLYSSDEQKWATPRALFDALDLEFAFELDAAADASNAKCRRYLTEADDSLTVEWSTVTDGAVWLNPPYGRGIGAWIRKAAEESRKGLVVVCLVFARTDTAWWHDYAMRAAEIRLIPGRVTFGDAKNSAPAPSCVLVFDEARKRPHFITQELPRR